MSSPERFATHRPPRQLYSEVSAPHDEYGLGEGSSGVIRCSTVMGHTVAVTSFPQGSGNTLTPFCVVVPGERALHPFFVTTYHGQVTGIDGDLSKLMNLLES